MSAVDDLSEVNLEVGKPATVTFTATMLLRLAGRHHDSLPLPARGGISLAVGVPVAFGDFPLPPRPATLPALPGPPPGWSVVKTVRNAPGDPLTPVTVELPWKPQDLNFIVHLQTPGTVRVSLTGKEFLTCVKWDFEPGMADPTQPDVPDSCTEERLLGPADKPRSNTLAITVRPEHVTGDWVVFISSDASLVGGPHG
ncbi:hypothetical protein ACFQX7_18650 [Luedemannella flava]